MSFFLLYNSAMANNIVNYLWLDSETTGLDSQVNDIIQLACIPIISGKEQSLVFNQHCQPIDWSSISDEALGINNITRHQLSSFQSAEVMVNNLITYLHGFKTKFTIAGFNVDFDRKFISALFKKTNKEREFLELFTQDIRDTFKRAKKLKAQLQTPNLKLKTLCEHFNIEINAHDALSDISATIKLDKILSNMLGETEIFTIDHYDQHDIIFPEPAQLHLHSMFSHTDSINSVKEWAIFAHDNKIPAISFVDHGNAASVFDTINISSIFSKENEVRKKDNIAQLSTPPIGIPGTGLIVSIDNMKFNLNAWAISNNGYYNLIKLASIGWKNKFQDAKVELPLVSIEEVISLKDGIIFGIPGINGPITDFILTRQHTEAQNLIKYLHSVLDIRLELAAIDVYRYFDSAIGFATYNIDGGNIQKHINNMYYSIAKDLHIKCVPVSDAHFLFEEDKIAQDCISKNSYDDGRYLAESRHIILAKEMFSVIKGHIGDSFLESDFRNMISNTVEIANLASNIEIKHTFHLPVINIPDDIKAKTDNYDMQTYYYMMRKINEYGRWNTDPAYVERFKKEIDVIMKNSTLNFIPYFLVYEDVCSYARSSGLMQGIARGSAGGSLLSYYLKIIHVDPVAAKLPFERFLSHARIKAGSFPDIDLDIARSARPLVIKYLQQEYKLGFAQISTFSKMKTKKAIRDAMYNLYSRNGNDPEVKFVCDIIDDSPQGVDEYDFLYGYIDQEDIEHEGEIHKKPVLANFFKQRPEVEELVKKLIGAIDGWSRHASAFVISSLDLSNTRVPTMIMLDKEIGDITVTQFDASMVERSGLVKADILGINTLNMMSECLDLIKVNHNVDLREEIKGVPAVYRLPDRDSGVFSDFYKRDTDSSFQFNSDIIKGAAKEFAPLCREDLALMTALYRPGAMDAKSEFVLAGASSPATDKNGLPFTKPATEVYVNARNGEYSPYYVHEDLKPYIEDTMGIIVFQEQVMAILVGLCGYTLEETDIIRSAIAKKKHDVIMSTFDRIREETAKRGWESKQSDVLCDTIMAFSRYSFNRSHSYAYAELGYITLYLKHHYPLEWWTSVLNNEEKEDKIRKYISYLGDKIAPPSLRDPKSVYVIKDGKIVAPIGAIKSIGAVSVNEITSKGPFSSIEDYVSRINHTRANIGAMSAIIKARAADDLMNNSISDYAERRKVFMKRYQSLRKNKTVFKSEMLDINPLSVFLQEKEYNLSFNKTLLSSLEILSILKNKWPGLKPTGRSNIPFYMKSENNEETWILSGVKVAENFLKSELPKRVGMILLFQSSTYKTGFSKKTNKPWHLLSISLSDGFNIIEVSIWDVKKALGWEKDTIVYVNGELKPGFRTPVSINVLSLRDIEKI